MGPTQPFTWGGSGSDNQWGIAGLPFVSAPAAGAQPFAPRIVWRSDGTGDAVTWADVYALLLATNAPGTEIYVDRPFDFLTIPAGVYNLQSAVFVSGANVASPVTIDMADGGILVDLAGITGSVGFRTNGTGSPPLQWTTGGGPVVLNIGSPSVTGPEIQNLGTVPAVEVDAAYGAFILQIGGTAKVRGGGDPSVPFFHVTASSGLIAVVTECVGDQFDSDTVSDDGTGLLVTLQDGTAATTWPTFAFFTGNTPNVAKGVVGGSGPSNKRPDTLLTGIPLGCRFYDTDTEQVLVWDGSAWDYPLRVDCSVNSARVDGLASPSPVLRAQSAGNVAGGFNGLGTGNKAIIGYRFPSGLSLGSISTIQWTWTDENPETAGLPVYANLLIDVNGDGSAFVVGVIDPTSPAPLGNGSTVTNLDGSKTTTWNGATDNLLIVNGLPVPPLPPGGPGFVAPTVPGAPLPAGWPSNSYSLFAILTAYPAARLFNGSSGDGGLPVAPNVTPCFMLITGDSTNQRQRAFRLRDVTFGGTAI